MDWNAETNADMLRRIAALLFALAGLADLASRAPRPVRDHVLGILRSAEAVARAYVFGKALDLGGALPPPVCLDGDDPDDAARLALGLRLLALALASLAARLERSPDGSGRIVSVANVEVMRKPGQPAACFGKSVPTPDTS